MRVPVVTGGRQLSGDMARMDLGMDQPDRSVVMGSWGQIGGKMLKYFMSSKTWSVKTVLPQAELNSQKLSTCQDKRHPVTNSYICQFHVD